MKHATGVKTRYSLVFCAVSLLVAFRCLGAAITAESMSLEDVQAAVDAAQPGDTVIVPAGTAFWDAALSVQKPITVRGAGIGASIVSNVQGDGSDPGTYEWFAFQLAGQTNGRVRLSGFEVRMNRKSQGVTVSGAKWSEVQIDSCKFSESIDRAVRFNTLLRALVYNCTFVDNLKSLDSYAISLRDESWQEHLTLGTLNCIVVEDCTFRYDTWKPRQAIAVASHGFGARAAWRHNTIVNNLPGLDFFPIIDAHGNQMVVESDNTGAHRGTRSLEFYENTVTSDVGGGSSASPLSLRGGTLICFNNEYFGGDVRSSFEMREEDGDNRFNFIDPSTYPGYDMHWCWIWGNTKDGGDMYISYQEDTQPFVTEGVNLFLRAPQEGDPSVIPGRQSSTPADDVYPYAPLDYPHPWRANQVPMPRNPRFPS